MTAEGDKHLAIILGLRAILSNKNVPCRNILYIYIYTYIYIYIYIERERERERERCDRSEERAFYRLNQRIM